MAAVQLPPSCLCLAPTLGLDHRDDGTDLFEGEVLFRRQLQMPCGVELFDRLAGRKRAHDPARLLALIANNDAANPISVSEWARLAEIPRKTLTDYLAEMRRNGWTKTVGEGNATKQIITNEGKAFLNR